MTKIIDIDNPKDIQNGCTCKHCGRYFEITGMPGIIADFCHDCFAKTNIEKYEILQKDNEELKEQYEKQLAKKETDYWMLKGAYEELVEAFKNRKNNFLEIVEFSVEDHFPRIDRMFDTGSEVIAMCNCGEEYTTSHLKEKIKSTIEKEGV